MESTTPVVAFLTPKSGYVATTPQRRFGLCKIPVCCSQCQPWKEKQAQVARRQIAQVERAAGKIALRKFLEADQEGKDQAAGHCDARSALKRARAEERQVDEEGQNPIEDEMSCLISKRNLIERLENAKLTQIGQDNNQNNEKREKNREPLHKKRETP